LLDGEEIDEVADEEREWWEDVLEAPNITPPVNTVVLPPS